MDFPLAHLSAKINWYTPCPRSVFGQGSMLAHLEGERLLQPPGLFLYEIPSHRLLRAAGGRRSCWCGERESLLFTPAAAGGIPRVTRASHFWEEVLGTLQLRPTLFRLFRYVAAFDALLAPACCADLLRCWVSSVSLLPSPNLRVLFCYHFSLLRSVPLSL